MRKLLFELNGATAVAEMHDDIVPKTCNAIWDILPVEGMSIHANWASREIMLHLAGDKVLRLPPEGEPSRGVIAPGDIVYFWRAPQMSRGKQLAYSSEFQRELSEFAIFYGEPSGGGLAANDPARSGDPSLQVITLFATFVDLPQEFTDRCEEIRHQGLQKLTVTRLDG
ncbi:MAG: DUF3830 family protein [Actinobacteria bacterium]|nr:DUF3830 family protein [Actinomycetota bacterium]